MREGAVFLGYARDERADRSGQRSVRGPKSLVDWLGFLLRNGTYYTARQPPDTIALGSRL